MKVVKEFFCVQEQKKYKAGDEYTGKRKDLGDYLEKRKRKPRENKNGKPNTEDK